MPNFLLEIQNLSAGVRHRTLFENFSTQIHKGDRIAIIGDNGTGKSTLLKILAGEREAHSGRLIRQPAQWVYVPQILEGDSTKSGSERFNARLSLAIAEAPDVLLLDEPTNHLDSANRRSLLSWLRRFDGTILFASHDEDFIRSLATKIWFLKDGRLQIFSGSLDDFKKERTRERESLERELAGLKVQEKKAHQKLMQEQKRESTSRERGEGKFAQKKWDKLTLHAKKGQGEKSHGKRRAEIREDKEAVLLAIRELRPPKELSLHFHLKAGEATAGRTLLSLEKAGFGWAGKAPLKTDIHLHLGGFEVLFLSGANGSGKTSFIRALLGDQKIERSGNWHLPFPQQIGFLDQHYHLLNLNCTVQESLAEWVPHWSERERRLHLLGFLFVSNEDLEKPVSTLSGGEKLRLSLALLSAKTPPLLILDEPTNNSDQSMRSYLLKALFAYPGSLIIVSHDTDFMRKFREQDKREWRELAF